MQAFRKEYILFYCYLFWTFGIFLHFCKRNAFKHKTMRRFLVLLCAALLGTIVAPAQSFKYLDTQNGLSSRRVIAVEKDYKGFMWFLTHEGIDKFNGKQFTHYKLEEGDRVNQQFPNLSNLQTDAKQNVWVLGKDGRMFRYDEQEDYFKLTFKFSEAIQTNRSLPLTLTKIDRKDNIWLCTKTAQFIYQIPSGEFFQLESPIKEEITCLAQADATHYYIGTLHNIYKATLNGKKLSVERDSSLENFHIVQHLHFHTSTKSLLISTLSDGFFLYNQQNKAIEKLGTMNDVNINAVIPYHDSNEEILIATDGNGVYKLNMRTKELQPFLSINHHYSNKMNGEIIKDIYEDEEGRLWMAIFPIGITIHSDKYPGYELVKHSQENPNSLINNQITYIMEDSEGDIWFATANGICCYYAKTGKWASLLSSYHQGTAEQNHVFISLCEASPGTILVGGYMSGMYRIDKKDMKPYYFSPQLQGYTHIRPDKYIRSIYRDKEGYIWAGGYYNLKRIHPETYEMEHYDMEYPVTYITSKDKDELWIGTINGLYIFNKKQKQVLPANLSSDIGNINTIYQDSTLTTYIGTSGNGLWIYDNQTQKLDNYSTKNSALICNNIYSILPDKVKGDLIISTESELVHFKAKERLFLNWTKEQGLMAAQFNTASGIRTQQGVFAFGSSNGAVILRNGMKLPRTFNSKMVLNDFNIHYQRMLPNQEGSPLTLPIDDTKSITLSHDQNIFSLNVSSINYDCPSRILYSWKLEGFYDEWTTPSGNNLIRYTNISPGKYKLHIRSILLDDGHTLEERTIAITITPPFSQSIWAAIIYITIIAFIIFAVMRFLWMRKDSLISKEKIQFFINTAHDIRTPLTLIKAPLSEIENNEKLTEAGKKNLTMAIESTEKLSNLANKLIDFQKEELYTSGIHVSKHELNQYMTECMKEFEMYASKKNIRLTFIGTDQELFVWMDRNKIDSIIHNLVSNALKYTLSDGHVEVKIRSNSKEWFLKISDTGIGIPASDRKKMFKQLFRGENAVNQRITGTGIGMLQTHRLVTRHKGKITVSSKENEGTIFRLRFPIDHPAYKRNIEQPTASTGLFIPTLKVAPTPTMNTSEEHPKTPYTILLAEDNPELRSFLHRILAEDYKIIETSDGKEALEQIQKAHPDLILSDIMMPEMRGDELCQMLKSDIATSHIPVVLLTALGDRESIIHGLETKADCYIVKPFDTDILKANISSILANKEFVRNRFAKLDYRTDDIQENIPGIDLDQEFLLKATDIIQHHLDNDFNVDDLCGKLHMSRSSLYNKIKALTGHSPSEFVKQIRLKQAAILLKSRKHTVAEISDMLGYGDPKYFTDIFKKYYGVTPSNYMKQEQK